MTRDGKFVDESGRFPEEKEIKQLKDRIEKLQHQLYEKYSEVQECPDCGEEEYRFLICDNCGYSRVTQSRVGEGDTE